MTKPRFRIGRTEAPQCLRVCDFAQEGRKYKRYTVKLQSDVTLCGWLWVEFGQSTSSQTQRSSPMPEFKEGDVVQCGVFP